MLSMPCRSVSHPLLGNPSDSAEVPSWRRRQTSTHGAPRNQPAPRRARRNVCSKQKATAPVRPTTQPVWGRRCPQRPKAFGDHRDSIVTRELRRRLGAEVRALSKKLRQLPATAQTGPIRPIQDRASLPRERIDPHHLAAAMTAPAPVNGIGHRAPQRLEANQREPPIDRQQPGHGVPPRGRLWCFALQGTLHIHRLMAGTLAGPEALSQCCHWRTTATRNQAKASSKVR